MLSKKKILLISPYFPFPLHSGGKAGIYNVLRELAKKYETYLLSYTELHERNTLNIREIRKYCKRVFTVARNEKNAVVNNVLPGIISAYYTTDMIREVKRVMKMIKPDAVQIEFLIMSQYVKYTKGTPTALTEHDAYSLDFGRSAYDRVMKEEDRFKEWGKMVSFAAGILPKFHSIVVLTNEDRRLLCRHFPGLQVWMIPSGVDVNYFRPARPGGRVNSKTILFLGNFCHYPNIDAIRYFLDDIFPAIIKKIPDVELLIVGSGIRPDTVRIPCSVRKHVNVIGEVDDIRNYYAQATVFVAPLRLGGGIKMKILEAMSSGVPVVATEEAVMGIRVKRGKGMSVASDNKEFAKKTIDLLKNESKRMALACNARKAIEETYSNPRIARLHCEHYDNMLQQKPIDKKPKSY